MATADQYDEPYAYIAAAGEIRKLIFSGIFPEDRRLAEEMLAKHLSFGRGTVRRALIELEHEGLVEIKGQYGTFVKDFSQTEITQLWRTRVLLEDFFVSTIAKDHRRITSERVAEADAINQEIISRADSDSSTQVSAETTAEVVTLDIRFHEKLATAAGYDGLTSELARIRNRLRLAAGKNLELNANKIRQIGSDHLRILKALRPTASSLVGDVVSARLAIRNHLWNSADRQGINGKIKYTAVYGQDPIWDLPKQLSPFADSSRIALGVARIILELLAAGQIAKNSVNTHMKVPFELLAKMQGLLEEHEDSTAIPQSVKDEFVTYDIQFHASLGFISGLMFVDDAVLYLWNQSLANARDELTHDTMTRVVQEHDKIVRAISYYSGDASKRNGTSEIMGEIKNHLLSAYTRSTNSACPTPESGQSDKSHTPMSVKEAEIVNGFLDWFIGRLSENTDPVANSPTD